MRGTLRWDHTFLCRTHSDVGHRKVLHQKGMHILPGGGSPVHGPATVQIHAVNDGDLLHRQHIRILCSTQGLLQRPSNMQHDSTGMEGVIAHQGWHLHLEWVPSDLIISDQVSRQSFTEMHEIDAAWTDLHRTATDSDHAHGTALHDVLALEPLCCKHLTLERWVDWRQCGC